MSTILTFFRKMALAVYKFAQSGESKCRICGICHHVCKITGQKNPVKVREE